MYLAGHGSDNAFSITSGGVITEIIDSTGDGAGGVLDQPIGIALGDDGSVYVAGYASDNVFRIEPGGAITLLIDSTGDGAGGVLTSPKDVAVDALGRVFVSGNNSDNALVAAGFGDCNLNGIPDHLDISGGTSLDCSSNGIPDECELAGNDCDSNGVPDQCDVDVNGNGIPDVCECVTDNYCLAAGNSVGSGAIIGSNGQVQVSANGFVLTVHGSVPNQFGLFFYGAQRQSKLWGEGMLCVKAPLYRIWPIIKADGSGAVSFPVDFTAPPANGGASAIDPFSTWNFQFWYRDPLGGPYGFNFSDGLRVVFCP